MRKRLSPEEMAEAEEAFESFKNSGVQAEKIREYCWHINGMIVFPHAKTYILNNKAEKYEKLSDLAKIDKIFINE